MISEKARVETVSSASAYVVDGDSAQHRGSVRARIFLLTFTLVTLVGAIWTLSQQKVYVSRATVLMDAPQAIDAGIAEADQQSLAIQRTILMGEDLLAGVARRLEWGASGEPGVARLREMLSVEQVPETNLIRLIAQGADPVVLPALVSAWIDVYTDERASSISDSVAYARAVVQGELDGLALKIEASRGELERYRSEHDIISAQREENATLSRLTGLNRALNNAEEAEVKARAQLESLRSAYASGQGAVADDDRRSVQTMERELEQLRAEMLDLQKRYTEDYIRKQPALRAIPQRIAELEAEISSRVSAGQVEELARAEQQYAAARSTTLELRQKLDDHKEEVAAFTRIYATNASLEEDLASLESMQREAQARLAQVEVSQVQQYPQVTVIEAPPGESERVGPDYVALLGATFGAALLTGIFGVWLHGFLFPRPVYPAPITLTGLHVYPGEQAAALHFNGQAEPKLGRGDSRLLQDSGGEEDKAE